MTVILIVYASIITVSFITGVFVTIYNNRHRADNNCLAKTGTINESLSTNSNKVKEKLEKTYYDIPVIVSVIDTERDS